LSKSVIHREQSLHDGCLKGRRLDGIHDSSCRSCGTELTRDDAQICDACGPPIAPAPDWGEYKQVTVLFADVVRSMDLASALGPERFREIMTAIFDCTANVVRRYGGTVDQFTGDGIMALFGAPVALEDHALRGCLAALGIQQETQGLAAEVASHDRFALQLRVGLNSGQVVAGNVGTGPFRYTAFGEHVGMAQRMESVAPPGGVMVSESTSRLVENVAVLAEPELVQIKGADMLIPARRLLRTVADPALAGRRSWPLVGRQWEMRALTGILDESIAGRGCVVGLIGAPGIGKTRLARELATIANELGVEVHSTFCEAHETEVPFHVVGRMVRAVFRVNDLDPAAARAVVETRFRAADRDDLLLLEDLTGIGDSAVALPAIDPDARRRRLGQMINTALLTRQAPALYIIEDVHWIDKTSETMFAEFFSVIARTHATVLITYRPEYRGALARLPGSQTIVLARLNNPQAAALTAEMLGSDPSIQQVAGQVTERAGGNPLFAQEIVRDLLERGVLEGDWGCYRRISDFGDVSVPATIQATIAARIDRLDPRAKRTLNAAAVIGSTFDEATLTSLIGDVELGELVDAELVHPVSFAPRIEYSFGHPLIRAVAYQSQLKAGRAESHRRLARALELREPDSVEENAALIAVHLEAAGDFRDAFDWHMRAGGWSIYRDIGATRLSWQRARHVADQLPADAADRMSIRIAPRTLLCGSAWRIAGSVAEAGFDELRELTTAVGDKRSLAIAMAGVVPALAFRARYQEGSQLASECVDLIEAIGDQELTVGLLYGPSYSKYLAGEALEALRLTQRVIDLAAGDLTKGNLVLGSPLALMTSGRGTAKCCLGISGWIDDLDNGIAMVRSFDPTTRVIAAYFKYWTMPNGAILPDPVALSDTAEVLKIAEKAADDFNLVIARLTRGLVLVHCDGAERAAGFELLAQARDTAVPESFYLLALPIVDIEVAKEKARTGDLDGAIAMSRDVLDGEYTTGEMIYRGACASVLVESLLQRDAAGDLEEAQAVIDQLAAVPTDPGFVLNEIPLLRLRALIARRRDDEVGYRQWAELYRTKAISCDFKGHVAMAEMMT
jgi:adenylate cyclase